MFLKLNVLVFLVIALFAFCSSNGENNFIKLRPKILPCLDEFSRKRRIPYHMPGFWYHFLPNPMEGMLTKKINNTILCVLNETFLSKMVSSSLAIDQGPFREKVGRDKLMSFGVGRVGMWWCRVIL